jgi:hypothetical protein
MGKTRLVLPISGSKTLTDPEKLVQVEMFWEQLAGFSIEEVEEAFRRCRGKLKWFPVPADVIERANIVRAERRVDEDHRLPEHIMTEEERLASMARVRVMIDGLKAKLRMEGGR